MGAVHASEMYARNVLNFVSLFVTEEASREGRLALDWDDELLAKTVWPERVVAPVAAAS
jgi:NAD(P) transhydrogenase subunit alpha